MSTRRGRRTGVRVASNTQEEGEMESPAAVFEKAKTRSSAKQKRVRYSLPMSNTSRSPDSASNPPATRLIRKLNRDSVDTSDLSTVATAPSDKPETPKEDDSNIPTQEDDFGGHDDDEDLVPPPPEEESEEEEVGLLTQEGATSSQKPVDPPTDKQSDKEEDEDDQAGGFDLGGGGDDESPDEEETPEQQTPESVREKRKRKLEKLEKKKSKKKQQAQDDSVEPKKRKTKKKKFNRFATVFSPKGVPGERDYTSVPVSDYKEEVEDTGLRRSKRARVKPLEFWRGEKYEYGANPEFDDEKYDGVKNMPVVTKIRKAKPTPYKKRKVPERKPQTTGKGRGRPMKETKEEEAFDDSKLRRKYNIIDDSNAHLWDEEHQDIRSLKVVQYMDEIEPRDLPMSSRKKTEGKVVGQASQSFQIKGQYAPVYPSYIVGHLNLPCKAVKDAESVGVCAQVFTVLTGQPKSVELAFGDPENDAVFEEETAQRFLLSPGDQFLVPPGNTYRLCNHSKTTKSSLTWTIIRQMPDD